MAEAAAFAGYAIVIGVGATIVLDLWSAALGLIGITPPNYGLVGRWIAHMPRGRFRHDAIAKADPVRGEAVIGWTMHYLIGVGYAALLLVIFGLAWARNPTLAPALIVGIVTVAAPFFVMQPGMGAGIAASRMPRPNMARLRSIVSHAIFGLGLFLSAWAANLLHP